MFAKDGNLKHKCCLSKQRVKDNARLIILMYEADYI